MKSIYLIGSLRNPEVPDLAGRLRSAGYDVFDDWYAAGPEADDYWQKYEEQRGHSYIYSLEGYAANHVASYDKSHLDRCDIGVLLLPSGRSSHLELGYMIGQGKPGYIVLDRPDRWDVMYRLATKVYDDPASLVESLYFDTLFSAATQTKLHVENHPPFRADEWPGITDYNRPPGFQHTCK